MPSAGPILAAVGAVTVLLAVALRALPGWGRAVEEHVGHQLGIGAAPFTGRWEWAGAPAVLVLVLAAAVGVWALPVVAGRARWRMVLAVSAGASAAWTLALTVPDGWSSVTAHLSSPYDHLAGVPRVGTPGGFLHHFLGRLSTYPTHVRGHPPGTVLALWGLDRVGLGGAVVAAVLVLCCAGATVAIVLVGLRSLAGEALARRTAPFLVLVPAAGFAMNLDLLFTALGAGAITCAVLATEPDRTSRRGLVAAAGGVLLGLALLCSYGLALLAAPLVVLVVVRRAWRPGAVMAVVAAAVVVLPALWGFWWPAGVGAVRHEYLKGLGGIRPGGAFAVFDVVAFLAVLGPVAVVAAVSLRDRRVLPVVGGVAASVLLALASQMSKGEVERIWQPFVPWLVVPCGVLAARLDRGGSWRRGRVLLAVQAGWAVVLAAGVRSPW